MLQNNLISERLLDWKNRQKLSQIGVLFDNRDVLLDDIQMEYDCIFLFENNRGKIQIRNVGGEQLAIANVGLLAVGIITPKSTTFGQHRAVAYHKSEYSFGKSDKTFVYARLTEFCCGGSAGSGA